MVFTENNRLGKYPAPQLIIVDECHLSKSKTWENVINYYDTFTIGFTGTPQRLDNKPLGDIYQELIQGVSTEWLINNKYLAPFKYYAPFEVDVNSIPIINGGDYVIKDLEKILNDKAIYSDAVKSYKKIANNERTIIYCVSIKHAHSVSDAFNSAGYSSIALSSKTPTKEREKVMERFRNGEITILCNVGIISEGISINEVSCTMLLRPTNSLALYWQQAMRSMRYVPNKTAKIIDCVGNYTRNPLPNEDVEWQLNVPVKKSKRINEAGNFYIRTCPNCYMVFKTADVCPYCGNKYPLTEREIKAKKEIELREIKEEELKLLNDFKKKQRIEVGKAHCLEDLWRIARERGYKPGWVYTMAKLKGIKR